MSIRTACFGALALAVFSGTAIAGALDSPKMMEPFFTDSSMKTMKSDDEMKAAWAAMSKDDQAMMMKECQDAAMSKPHAPFCEKLKALGGANK